MGEPTRLAIYELPVDSVKAIEAVSAEIQRVVPGSSAQPTTGRAMASGSGSATFVLTSTRRTRGVREVSGPALRVRAQSRV
jgi:hypothetical protein